MAGRITVDCEQCKGCGLCINACPRDCIRLSQISNKKGYFPAESNGKACTGCGCCALVCPDAAISVYRESRIEDTDSSHNPMAQRLLKEKA